MVRRSLLELTVVLVNSRQLINARAPHSRAPKFQHIQHTTSNEHDIRRLAPKVKWTTKTLYDINQMDALFDDHFECWSPKQWRRRIFVAAICYRRNTNNMCGAKSQFVECNGGQAREFECHVNEHDVGITGWLSGHMDNIGIY